MRRDTRSSRVSIGKEHYSLHPRWSQTGSLAARSGALRVRRHERAMSRNVLPRVPSRRAIRRRRSCGRLNLVERFFGLLTEKALKRGSHTSIAQLRAAILAYVDAHNERDTPFKWVKTADEILDNMRRFGLRVQQVHGQ
jgi:hypothetical protein